MGSGISMSEKELDDQEVYVKHNFEKAKKNMSKYKDGTSNRYSDCQIKMKLREEYYNNPYSVHQNSNRYIPSYEWKTWNNGI